jgi:hypothetical protein
MMKFQPHCALLCPPGIWFDGRHRLRVLWIHSIKRMRSTNSVVFLKNCGVSDLLFCKTTTFWSGKAKYQYCAHIPHERYKILKLTMKYNTQQHITSAGNSL